MERFARLDGDGICALFELGEGVPALLHLGAPVSDNPDSIRAATSRGLHENEPDVLSRPDLLPVEGSGFLGTPAIELLRGGLAMPLDFTLERSVNEGTVLEFRLGDKGSGVTLTLRWEAVSEGVMTMSARLLNSGSASFGIARLASLALPLPGWADHATRYAGRWAGEMREDTGPIERGAVSSDSRGGRPGFDGGNWLLAHEQSLCAKTGQVLGMHLAWSGDHISLLERNDDGAMQVQMGARIDHGEVILEPGESFETPPVCLGFSEKGRNGLANRFAAYMRHNVLPDRAEWPARRVHLNSWEALGFDMDEASLKRLASDAAALGIERFVIDDGWFHGRRNDRTSLGDWTADEGLFPDGLGPLADHVIGLGMDVGIWVEPEMISPDSDLYRANPDWCIHQHGVERATQRNQLVLDLTISEAAEHVFARLNTLLSLHPIAYMKWDHNRPLFPRAGKGIAQTEALYALLDRLRVAHPKVEFESCASGGGRIDYGILSRAHRVWPSDNNDPVERLRIMEAWGQFLPPEVLGSHVGPSLNPVTGRSTDMDFRAKVALFGHMGIETDPAAMDERERAVLAVHIAHYKGWRNVLHSGAMHQLDMDGEGAFGRIAVAADGARALVLIARADLAVDHLARPVRLAGLDDAATYKISLLEPWPHKASQYVGRGFDWRAGIELTGRFLQSSGVAIPLVHPETAWLLGIEKQ